MSAKEGNNIRHLADVHPPVPRHHRDVDIRIAFDATDPPSGLVERWDAQHDTDRPSTDNDRGQRFSGWLDLLRVLYELLPQRREVP